MTAPDPLWDALCEPASVLRACQRIIAANDPHRLRRLTEGCTIKSGQMIVGPVLARLPRPLQPLVGLTLLRAQGALDDVQAISVVECDSLVDLRLFVGLPALRSLTLESAHALVDLSALAEMPALESLVIGACGALSSLAGIEGLPRLRAVDLWDNPKITDLAPLCTLPVLRSLELAGEFDLAPVFSLTELTSLSLSAVTRADLIGLEQMEALRTLELGMEDTPLMALSLPSLEVLRISSASDDALSALADLPRLVELHLDYWEYLEAIHGTTVLERLRTLAIDSCPALGYCDDLPALETLRLTSCSAALLSRFPVLPRLRALRLSCMGGEVPLRAIRAPSLEVFWLGFSPVCDLSPLAGFSSLRRLELHSLPDITDLRPLVALEWLEVAGDDRFVQLWAAQRAEEALSAAPPEGLDVFQAQLSDLLRSGDEDAVSQALELLESLGDVRVAQALAAGCSVESQGQISPGAPLSGAPETVQRQIALRLMRRLGWLDHVSHLNLESHEEMTDLSAIAGLTRLRRLCLPSGEALRSLSGLETLTGLRSLSGYSVPVVDDFDLIGSLQGLQVLTLDDCEMDGLPAFLGRLSELRSLTLDGCWLSDLRALPLMPRLDQLFLSSYPLRSLKGIANAPVLSQLSVYQAGGALDLAALAAHHGLRMLSLHACPVFEDLSPLAGLTGLQELQLTQNAAISDLSPIAGLLGLRTLRIHMSGTLSDCTPLAGLVELSSLTLGDCSSIENFSMLSSMVGLTQLRLSLLPGLADLSPLRALFGLRELAVLACPRVTDLSPLSACAGLRKLSVGCEHADLSTLPPLLELEELNLCLTPVPDLSVLLRHPRLRRVVVRHPSLVGADLSVLDRRPDLEILGQEELVAAWAARRA